MKVILIKDAEGLGVVGDTVQVKDGYARNYLIPRKVAVEATEGALKVVQEKKRIKANQEKKLREEFASLAEKIKNTSCTISVEAGEGDKLFGSVTSEMIAETLKAEGIELDKRKINLKDPIKALGVFNVEVNLHPEVKAQLRVWVVKK